MIINVPDREFKVIVTKMLTYLGRWMDKQSQNFNKEIENIRKYQRNYNWIEKYSRGVQQQTGWGRRTNLQAGRQNNRTHPDRAVKWKIILKSEDTLRDLWDNLKWNNTCIMRVPKGEERERERARKLNIWSNTAWKLP